MKKMSLCLLLLCIIGGLCQDYRYQSDWPGNCKNQAGQSPINIVTINVKPCQDSWPFWVFATDRGYQQTPPTKKDLQTPFIESTLANGKYDKWDLYHSLQFHFHHRSQHQINGRSYDLELHIVYQNPDNKRYSVYAVLFEARDGAFPDPFDRWNLDTNISISQRFPIKIDTFLQYSSKLVYHYKGSLTTPECADNVDWFVSGDIISIKRSNFDKTIDLINGGSSNNRKVQPVGSRQVIQVGAICRQTFRNSNRHMRLVE